jgi:isoquinoline 1-oxidoreductase subunit beta
MTTLSPSRRGIIFAGLSAAGGLAIGVSWPAQASASTRSSSVVSDGANASEEMTAFLVIEPDNSVTVRVPHAEMGQGTATALAMLVAEELECDWAKVRFEYASANRNAQAGGKLYDSMQTSGSSGLRTSVTLMQQAGASARERLRVAAAQHWNVDPANCSVASGKCLHRATNRAVDFGALAPAAAGIKLKAEPAIKAPKDFKLVGKWTPRLDTAPKLDGSAKYGIDADVPGMVYAAVLASPVVGGKLRSIDESGLKGLRGIISTVKLPGAVVVVADRYWRAKSGLDALKIDWDDGGYGDVSTESLRADYLAALESKPMFVAAKKGNPTAALGQADIKMVEATYEVPFLAHAPMEPLNCTVSIQADRADVWISTQAPMRVLATVAKETGLPPATVHIHNQFLGGAFGRRAGVNQDELDQAIVVAKAIGKPVKLIWTREMDIRRDRFRPQAFAKFRGGLDPSGNPTALATRLCVPSLLHIGVAEQVASEHMAVECIADSPYELPNSQVEVLLKNSHVPVWFWRSVGGSQNAFFIESFVDELAHAASQDPYKFRRAMLAGRPDALGVLDAMAKHGDWGKPLPNGQGRGMAIIETYGSLSGQVVEVTVSQDGKLTVNRVTNVLDPYHVANPNTVHQQLEGAVIWALSAALWGEITIRNGATVQSNFHDYRLAKYADTPPRIEVVLVPSGGPKWGGVGEPGVGPFAPALCNAIFAATGHRIRRLPVSQADLSWT